MPSAALLKKRGLGYGRKIPPINFRVSGDQLAELEAEVAAVKKTGEVISVNEAARRRCFPDGPKLIRLEVVMGPEVDVEALSLEEVLGVSLIRKHAEQQAFKRWVMWDGVWDRPGRYLVAELTGGVRLPVARLIQGQITDLPEVKSL